MNKILRAAEKNAAGILTGFSVAALCSTIYLLNDAAPEAEKEILKFEKRKKRKATVKEKLELTWKIYAPTAASAIICGGCAIASNSVNAKKYASLMGVYTVAEKNYDEYRKRTHKVFGQKATAMEHEINSEKFKSSKSTSVDGDSSYGVVCLDSFGRKFVSSAEKINRAVNDMNHLLLREDWVTLNELYNELDLEDTKIGSSMGWHVDDGLIEISLDSMLDGDEPVLYVEFAGKIRHRE